MYITYIICFIKYIITFLINFYSCVVITDFLVINLGPDEVSVPPLISQGEI